MPYKNNSFLITVKETYDNHDCMFLSFECMYSCLHLEYFQSRFQLIFHLYIFHVQYVLEVDKLRFKEDIILFRKFLNILCNAQLFLLNSKCTEMIPCISFYNSQSSYYHELTTNFDAFSVSLIKMLLTLKVNIIHFTIC